MKVLVADDDIMSRYLTIKVLSDAGFQVVSAANGRGSMGDSAIR